MADKTFSIEEALKVQGAMRASLGQGPETFPIPAFVGMLSDEIEQLRRAGRSDASIAELIRDQIGREIEPDEIARYYAPPEQRRRG